jgi:hypothetical protein
MNRCLSKATSYERSPETRGDYSMTALRFGLSVILLFWINACAAIEGTGGSDLIEAGQTEAELVKKRGQPQEILPTPQGGKIYVYTTYRIDQLAVMGSGAWAKPEQTYYWLDPQGIVTKAAYYPYGKKAFIFSDKAEAPAKEVVTAHQTPVAARQESPSPGEAAPRAETAKPAPPSVDREAHTRLEPNMSKDGVRRLLGLPDRTEGFTMEGKSIVVWFYPLKDRQGRMVSTPLVFEKNRLVGWGERYYQQLHKKPTP